MQEMRPEMFARVRHVFALLTDAFWLVPAGCVLLGGALAVVCVRLDLGHHIPQTLASGWLYDGGPTGARTLLGAVAASAIGVAGTVFSITIAALSLAAGQMGPRLLRNFVSDRGNQITLGVLLGTFTYALLVLRSVRTEQEGGFTPHLSMSVGILLAMACVGMLIYFVGHVATRINVDTVIALVGDDLSRSVREIASKEEEDTSTAALPREPIAAGFTVASRAAGYLQSIDTRALVDWAETHRVQFRLRVRPGDYVFPNAAIAWVSRQAAGAEDAVRGALLLGSVRTPYADLEFAVRQLVEVAMRALSPGINDPFSAISVIDRLGGALCELAGVPLPSGQYVRHGTLLLSVPVVDYDGLTDTMFHPLRQYGASSAMVLIRLLDVLAAVDAIERDADRRATLRRHAGLVLAQGERSLIMGADRHELHLRHERFRCACDATRACRQAAG